MIYKNSKLNKGYTLLFAVLVSSLVLAVGISILNISKKEFLLSSSARESTTAFYAADSGLECAVYFDIQDRFTETKHEQGARCGLYTDVPSISTLDNKKYTFSVNLNGFSCANVEVIKNLADTDIYSYGYNLGWNSSDNTCSSASPRRVERAIHYHYSTTP